MNRLHPISFPGSECQEMEQKVQGDSYWKRPHILFDQYRVVVGRIGIVYDGDSVLEAKRQYRLFMLKSKTAGSSSPGESVTLFKNYEIINEYHPPDREPSL
jgi:hypothetical protein